jgi:hypothetical protein
VTPPTGKDPVEGRQGFRCQRGQFAPLLDQGIGRKQGGTARIRHDGQAASQGWGARRARRPC